MAFAVIVVLRQGLICSQDWSGNCDLPASASKVLISQAWVIITGHIHLSHFA